VSVISGGITERIEVALTGAVTQAGQLSGTFTFSTFHNNILVYTGNGTLTGSLAGNTLTVSATGRFLTGETCTFTASFSGTRGSAPQVRLLNGLTCNGQSFTAELRSAQGNTWTSVTGVFSPYQTTARVIGPFEFRGCGPLVVVFPSTFTLPTAGPQLFTLGLDFQNNQVVLLLFQATAGSGTTDESPVGSAMPLQTLEGSEPVPRTEEYQLKQR
jgi:hypothetical protein